MPRYLKQAAAARTRGGKDAVRATVAKVVGAVRERGDAAVREFSEQFDGWSTVAFRLEPDAIEKIVGSQPRQIIDDILSVQQRVRRFAEYQLASLRDFEVETEPGVSASWSTRCLPARSKAHG
jgi:sulfopropanediol 3-dehydrogenase